MRTVILAVLVDLLERAKVAVSDLKRTVRRGETEFDRQWQTRARSRGRQLMPRNRDGS